MGWTQLTVLIAINVLMYLFERKESFMRHLELIEEVKSNANYIGIKITALHMDILKSVENLIAIKINEISKEDKPMKLIKTKKKDKQ